MKFISRLLGRKPPPTDSFQAFIISQFANQITVKSSLIDAQKERIIDIAGDRNANVYLRNVREEIPG